MSAAELPAEAAPEEDRDRPHVEVVAEPGRMAALLADLRPYLSTRDQLRTPFAGVGAGTRVLVRQGCTWIAQDGWIWEGWTKVGAIAGGVYFGLPAVWTVVQSVTGPYAPFVPTVAAVCGCVAAKRFAPAEAAEKTPKTTLAAKAAAEEPDEDEPEYLDEQPDEPIESDEVVALIRTVAARQQHQGAHLDDLLAEPLFEGWDKAALKAALTDEWGLPVEGFKLIVQTPSGKAQRNRDGVRLRHLPPAPARGAGEGPVRGLSLVPSQTLASTSPGGPASTPSGAPAEPVVEAAVGPSPTTPAVPS
ncbi:hypothetical protein ACFCZ1_27000 [Streptomyces sp. NPDC056224]|uniref:hypothetical protein n=1 Tax=Streptomyces sp. NPDC056224 TaxID=3345750 RepID=UPI0035DD03F6